jgi:hypothetical protein
MKRKTMLWGRKIGQTKPTRITCPWGQPAPKNPRPSREFEKNVKIAGTNSISHLESIKAAKNELKTNSK